MNHYVIEDNWYEGYFVPQNSVFILNQWALHYDEEYPDPEKVFPSRRRHSGSGEY
jgi:cytochrome P450